MVNSTKLAVMDWSHVLIVVLVLLLACGGIVAAVYVLLNAYLKKILLEQEAEWKFRKTKELLPVHIQAYERLILLCERINPERLVFRINRAGMSAKMLQAEMLKTIRDEFDHNLTQQLYISNEAWASVKAAREETVKILNMAAEHTPKDGTGYDYSARVLELIERLDRLPTDIAADILKAEFRKKIK
ncbi:MAG: hypothetical protein Kow0075_10070 [Salibacteraceae bacterium]